MSKAHELLSRRPFDLYQLHLFRLVAESGSFTRAAQITGLTQSAITRQIQSIEQQLGLSLRKLSYDSLGEHHGGRQIAVRTFADGHGNDDVIPRPPSAAAFREEFAESATLTCEFELESRTAPLIFPTVVNVAGPCKVPLLELPD